MERGSSGDNVGLATSGNSCLLSTVLLLILNIIISIVICNVFICRKNSFGSEDLNFVFTARSVQLRRWKAEETREQEKIGFKDRSWN